LSDMGVVKLTVVVDFPRQSGRNWFRDLFNGNASACQTMDSKSDRAISSW
jgi:hypothetical protein